MRWNDGRSAFLPLSKAYDVVQIQLTGMFVCAKECVVLFFRDQLSASPLPLSPVTPRGHYQHIHFNSLK